ncbi:subclass B3 metallo-beta-lactamase [Massilia sp. TS11]|uniref:subclass B3 metallo-beta-lactamase n=1 Tax=Massilia sp. TS11 TaxID=2908003 RepID=UPI001EDA8459|nr:subclass B3 metallo-beta-lactamase [Massilia sp. TS11]MCG2584414.1 subclass B3 metallo-beta-lactamase [Massilia sp. TS11]
MIALLLAATLASSAIQCSMCEGWNAPQKPFRVYGNTWYVGPKGLSSLLITSNQGHILVDGALPQSAAVIAANIKTLGFRIEDVKLIVNSHAHFDHAGGIAELQRLSGAQVAAPAWGARAMQQGDVASDDPQYGDNMAYPAVRQVRVVKDGETLHVGPLSVTMHETIGHTPGGASWTWNSCHDGDCKHIVYAESLTAVSHDSYKFSAHPEMIKGFERSFAALDKQPCDILVSTHPDFSNVFEHLAEREAGKANAFIDPTACKSYVAQARKRLSQRLSKEN